MRLFCLIVGSAHFQSPRDRVCVCASELHEHIKELFRDETPRSSDGRTERKRADVSLLDSRTES